PAGARARAFLQILSLSSILPRYGRPRGRKEEVMRRLLVGLLMLVVFIPRLSLAQPAAPTAGGEVVKGVEGAVLSIVYFPAKVLLGTVGALLGGFSGWATGGNERAAEGVWRPTVGGSYFITPETLDGTKPFLPFDGGPYVPPPPAPAQGPSGPLSYQP